MEPRHRTPSGATAPTTCARSAVGRVVRLEQEAGQAAGGEQPCQRDVVDAPRDDVRIDVDVRVEPTAHELARALGGDRVRRDGHGPPYFAPSALARASAIVRAPASPTSRSGRSVPLATRSSAGKRPGARQRAVEHDDGRLAAERLRRRRDDGQRAAVDDVARRGERPARRAGGQAVEGVDEHDGVAAAGGDAAGLLDGVLDRLACGVGATPRTQRGRRLERVRASSPRSPRAARRRARRDVDALAAPAAPREPAQRLGLAGARGPAIVTREPCRSA